MPVNLKLAEAFVDIRVDMAKFSADLAKVHSMLAGLGGAGGGGVAAGLGAAVAAGMAQGVSRGAGQARTAMGQFASQAMAGGVASGMAAGMTRGVAGARNSVAPLGAAVQAAVAQGMAAGATAGGARWNRNALGQFTGAGGAGGRGGIFGGIGGGLGQAGMGLAQGLGIGGLAFSPGQMAGQMVGQGLKEAVSNSMDLEQTFVGIRRVTGESAENVEKFKRSIFDLGKTQAGVSIKDLTDISMAGAKSGVTDREGLAGLETFTRGLAKVRNSIQGMGTEQLANDMTRMLTLFHQGTGYVESFGSMLARMDNVSTSSASDILDMSKNLSGTFASLNLGMPAVMAFSSVLADVGLTNKQGASSFTQILRSMASESEKFAEAIGVPVDVFQEKVRTDAMGALGLLIAKFRQLNEVDPIKAQEFISELGFRGVKTGAALQQLSSMFEQVQERTKMAIEEETTLGSLQAANNLNSTTALSQLQKLRNSYEELSDAIGKVTLGPLSQLAKDATSMVQELGDALGVGKAGGPGRMTAGERLELAKLERFGNEAKPDEVARRDELRRKGEERAAFNMGMPLSAGPSTVEEQIQKLERSKAGANPAMAAAIDAAIANLKGGQATRAAQAGAAGPAEGAEMVGPPRPIGLGLQVRGGIDFAREQDQKQAAMFAAEAADREEKRVARVGRPGAMLARPGGIPEISPFRKGFMDPGELADIDRRKALESIARPPEAKRQGFSSQSFSDPSDFARSAIQTALSDKDDPGKKTAENTKQATTVLEQIRDKLLEGTRMTPDRANNGPLILRT